MRTVVKTVSGYTAVLDRSHPKISQEGGLQVFDDRFEVPIASYKADTWAEVHVTVDPEGREEPVQDRSDEIRAAVVTARQQAWAAQLRYAAKIVAESGDAPAAEAVLDRVIQEIELSAGFAG